MTDSDAKTRLLISTLVGVVICILLPDWMHLSARIISSWLAWMICFLTLTWVVMLKATPKTMRRKAQQQDEGRIVILSLITTAACVSLLAIGFMLNNGKGAAAPILAVYVSLAALTILGSWLLVHTVFALHYAHGYYQDRHNSTEIAAGLEFPDDRQPDYWDFLYFSFGIGMTSQVSDVAITSTSLRRLTLLHSILSFFFNTTILAMSINIIAGLI
ncbi:MAG TPA: DUF1345 domain-containing protein [Leptolyngbyaceae cyanobacterium M33_DOE_097]|uniref:DUF1345 domain-containing protein n=1 Tax=Oscillatoriales cyanobacterium SpSt-418 TaxID=2282169 RepID=A0A7C3KJ60_9CYAN|nr:DUF1345 domain-containing protein [Leptolyngbyaceae cyanobacterium M33_DOE_097]